MANTSRLEKEYAQYISSGRWICSKSPTGAHYWKEVTEDESGIFVCKYCYEVRRFPVIYEAGKYLHLDSLCEME